MKDFTERDLITKVYGLGCIIWLEGRDLFVQRPMSGSLLPIRLPLDEVTSIEVSTKSVAPPLTIFGLTVIAFFSIWGFVGAWRNFLELDPLMRNIMIILAITSLASLAVTIARTLFATLKIKTRDSNQLMTRFVLRRAAQTFASHVSRRSSRND